jgi:ADP-ribosylglycohydrolase
MGGANGTVLGLLLQYKRIPEAESSMKSTVLYKKTLGCLIGGIVGDAIGTPSEGKTYPEIEDQFGWIGDFDGVGTDDTILKHLLADALVDTRGYATFDDWAKVWMDRWNAIFGEKVGKFFQSVLHTATKLRISGLPPRMVALGNMPSSSSAMCISPIGIVNACNPRQAALQAYNVAGLIHIHDVGFCQDGAAAMAAAVAEAFNPDATVDSIVEASCAFLPELSGAEMRSLIEKALKLAGKTKEFKAFRKAVYEDSVSFFRSIACDSRETVPITIALFLLADGDVEKCATFGANFGRDTDTIASMCCAVGGAFRGIDNIKKSWVEKVKKGTDIDQEGLAEKLAQTAIHKMEHEKKARAVLRSIA